MIYSGTGHRPPKLGGYSEDVFIRLVLLAKENIPDDTSLIISGMALGWDTALAQAAVEKNIPFIAAIPFLGQEKRWPQKSCTLYHNLLSMAKDIVYVSDPGYSPVKMQKRNEWMVDHSDKILALFDGSYGGTFNCISYAKRQHKQIINLWDKFEQLQQPL